MIIIGVDFHPVFQQIASVDTDTGEFQEKHLAHREEAEKFYRALVAADQKVYFPTRKGKAGYARQEAGSPRKWLADAIRKEVFANEENAIRFGSFSGGSIVF